jgi:cyclopropane fatty-acyl-phospholipid synthase-like methyltransferase
MSEIVLAHAARNRVLRVLDIGCGTGSLVFRLAEAMPLAVLAGIDVSEANIHAAERQNAGRGLDTRVRFAVADYLTYGAEPFDVMVADGVLHLIPGDTAALIAKLARDLRPGGVLVCSMPFDCTYNRVFAVLRRGLRRVQSPWLDERILQVGRVLHGRDMDENGLRERVPYMYTPPARLMSERLADDFAGAGLDRVADYAMPSTSLSQLKHRVTVFGRRHA